MKIERAEKQRERRQARSACRQELDAYLQAKAEEEAAQEAEYAEANRAIYALLHEDYIAEREVRLDAEGRENFEYDMSGACVELGGWADEDYGDYYDGYDWHGDYDDAFREDFLADLDRSGI